MDTPPLFSEQAELEAERTMMARGEPSLSTTAIGDEAMFHYWQPGLLERVHAHPDNVTYAKTDDCFTLMGKAADVMAYVMIFAEIGNQEFIRFGEIVTAILPPQIAKENIFQVCRLEVRDTGEGYIGLQVIWE